MKPKIIGLVGPIGVGKSTVARGMEANDDASRVSFADPLKRMLLAIGVPYRNLYGTQAEKLEPLDILCGKSARYAAQTLGTEWGRRLIGEQLWVNAWRNIVLGSIPPVVADDLRFQNEADAVRELGGEVVRLERPGVVYDMSHESERQSSSIVADRVVTLEPWEVD